MIQYSVLMSVYRKERPDYLRRAVDSMLCQTISPSEFVLVCDGPLTQELDSAIAYFQVQHPSFFRVIRLGKQCGLGNALRTGLLACSFDIVARMDSDDIAIPQRMEWQLDFLKKNESISAVGGQIAEFSEDPDRITGYRTVPLTSDDVRNQSKRRNPMNHMTVTFRKEHVLAVGNYEDFDRFEDYYLWIRMLLKGYSLANVDQVCVKARANGDMYGRRGGWAYFRQTYKLERFMFENRFCSLWQYICNLGIRFVATVVVSNWGRQRLLYPKLLREEKLYENNYT